MSNNSGVPSPGFAKTTAAVGPIATGHLSRLLALYCEHAWEQSQAVPIPADCCTMYFLQTANSDAKQALIERPELRILQPVEKTRRTLRPCAIFSLPGAGIAARRDRRGCRPWPVSSDHSYARQAPVLVLTPHHVIFQAAAKKGLGVRLQQSLVLYVWEGEGGKGGSCTPSVNAWLVCHERNFPCVFVFSGLSSSVERTRTPSSSPEDRPSSSPRRRRPTRCCSFLPRAPTAAGWPAWGPETRTGRAAAPAAATAATAAENRPGTGRRVQGGSRRLPR